MTLNIPAWLKDNITGINIKAGTEMMGVMVKDLAGYIAEKKVAKWQR